MPLENESLREQRVLWLSNWLIEYPFVERLYSRALEAAALQSCTGIL